MDARILQSWLVELVPELAGCYLAFVSQLPSKPWEKADLLGLTMGRLDLSLQPYLDWHGRAPTILLNDIALRQEAAELVLGDWFDQEQAERFAFGRVLLHEASHVLTRPPPYYDVSDRPSTITVESVALLLSVPLDFLAALIPNVRVGGDHGATFMRIACHLAYRAQQRGVDVRAGAVVPDHYQQPHASTCAEALADELVMMSNWPIEAIKVTPPPQTFMALWERHELERQA